MNDFEKLARDLAARGYHVHLRFTGLPGAKAWHCDLHNSVIVGVPSGDGAVALEAIQAAEAVRAVMETEKSRRKAG